MAVARRYEDLEVWQIADALKLEVYDGVDRGYFTLGRVAAAQQLVERSIKCSTKFIVYLKGCAKKRRRADAIMKNQWQS